MPGTVLKAVIAVNPHNSSKRKVGQLNSESLSHLSEVTELGRGSWDSNPDLIRTQNPVSLKYYFILLLLHLYNWTRNF